MSLSSIDRRIAMLTREMTAAAANEEFELAARLRNEIAGLKGQSPTASAPEVRKPPPGQMGLGTHLPVGAPPPGWKRPKKPDLLTTGPKPRGKGGGKTR